MIQYIVMSTNETTSKWLARRKEELERRQGRFRVPGSGAKAQDVNQMKRKQDHLMSPQSRGKKLLRLARPVRSESGISDKENDIVEEAVEKQETAKEKCLNWMAAAEAAGIRFVPDDEEISVEEAFEPVDATREYPEEALDTLDAIIETKKKKTPKESRMEKPKVKAQTKVSEVHKKTFKEAFNTDKSCLEKRQIKYSTPQNFLIIVEDNINSAVCTSGKLMVYGKGEIADKFFKGGIQYDKEVFFVHKNAHNFEENTNINTEIDQEKGTDTEEVDNVEIHNAQVQTVTEKPGPSKSKVNHNKRPLTKYDRYLLATKQRQQLSDSSSSDYN